MAKGRADQRWLGRVVGQIRAAALPDAQPDVVPRFQPTAALPTCAIVGAREVLQGVVNSPRIDGKDGVAGSIPAGTPHQTSSSGRVRPRSVYALRAGGCRLPEICQSDLHTVSRCGAGGWDQVPARCSAASSTHSTLRTTRRGGSP